MGFWCKSEKHPTFLDHAIERDVDAVFACAAPDGCVYDYCRSCKETTVWRKGQALVNAFVWGKDFGDETPGYSFSGMGAHQGATMWRGGPAKTIEVNKCTSCGRSVS